ncbi:hypothetical protein E5288_WYG006304 [Bos mutus]|uniref:Uncharacterized protein n=1 Tax=Bos mutus TaxID=72004 RepID=A0A6B0QTJ5_9CETA|nr:hypothetical protein [Bos mutus]
MVSGKRKDTEHRLVQCEKSLFHLTPTGDSTMSVSDRLPDYPVNSDFVKKLKAALEGRDEARLKDLICADVRHVDAVIELANDDWMKDPSAQLPPGVLVGDLEHLKPLMDKFFQDANVVFEIKKDEMVWQVKSPATFGLSGLWTLEYKRELTTPLCIAAAQGHTACSMHRGSLLAMASLESKAVLSSQVSPPRPLCTNQPHHTALRPALLSIQPHCLTPWTDPDLDPATLPQGRVSSPSASKCAQALLEHGASVLKSCAAVPTVIEVLFNSYSQLRVSESWKDVIPEEVFQFRSERPEQTSALSGFGARSGSTGCSVSFRPGYLGPGSAASPVDGSAPMDSSALPGGDRPETLEALQGSVPTGIKAQSGRSTRPRNAALPARCCLLRQPTQMQRSLPRATLPTELAA